MINGELCGIFSIQSLKYDEFKLNILLDIWLCFVIEQKDELNPEWDAAMF